ncbi:Protein ACTIVITY OF BC1 COMPLEX KINASE 3 [Cardamine amara subsp. amara]|uniref:Protein ACTIVITY OF BC1 COMPLEX KINASE 3 n=1 Tax=Cardamine amara subsp. amara TaxID=228776 RepID=A0ABD0ZQY8_CARAN
MASVSPSPSRSTIATPVRRSPRAAFAVAELRRLRQRRAIPPVSVGLGHFGEVVRNDVEFLKNKIGIGIRWANEAFRVPEVTKSAEEVFWLRHLEDTASPPLESQSWPQPSYSGLSGVDLFMADVKALEAYAGYFYWLSKMWSRPLPEVYDPQAVSDYFNCRPHVVAYRLLEVFSAFMIAAIRLRTSSDKGTNLESSGQNFGMVMKETMLHLGPTFIKVGQSLSTRPDIIGTETSKALSELHDQIPPFPWPEAAKIIEEELGAPVESFFSQFSQETVAAASFGQVYRGRTLDGSDVAVKVQRPDMRHAVLRDIYILRLGLGVLRKIAKRENDIRVYADELGKGLAGELDFTLEAANASEFREAHSRFSYIRVPKVYQHLTRKRVLTMEWMVGESPTDLLSISSQYHDFESHEKPTLEARRRLLDLVNKGVEATLVQLLDTGILHADPHPGNLRYTTSRQIGFLDFGLVCRMQRKHQLAMLAAIVHIVNGDWACLVEALTDMDVIKPGINTRRFTMDLEYALGEVELKNGIPDIEFTKVLSKIVKVALNYQLRMPPYFTLVLRSLACLEGLAAVGDPNFKTFEAAYPFVVQKLLTENSAATRKILHSAVLNRKKEFRWERVDLFLSKSSTRKRSPLITSSTEETSVDSSSNQTDKDADTVSLVLRLLASTDGVVFRRLLMAANGTSLIRTFISREAHVIRQKLCTTIADTLYQWMVGILRIRSLKFISLPDPPPSSAINITVKDFKILIKDKRVRVILRKILESAKSDRVLMLRFCWTSLVMSLTTTALTCHRFVISVSEGYINYLSLSAPVTLPT